MAEFTITLSIAELAIIIAASIGLWEMIENGFF